MVCVIEFTFVTDIEVKIYTNKKRILKHRIQQTIKNKRETKWNWMNMKKKPNKVRYNCDWVKNYKNKNKTKRWRDKDAGGREALYFCLSVEVLHFGCLHCYVHTSPNVLGPYLLCKIVWFFVYICFDFFCDFCSLLYLWINLPGDGWLRLSYGW